MCPGHLAEKWAKEINEEIPFAKAMVISDFKQLIKLREHGSKREGKEFLFCRRTSANCPIRVFLRRLNSEKEKCTTRYAASVGHLCMEMSVNVDLKVLR